MVNACDRLTSQLGVSSNIPSRFRATQTRVISPGLMGHLGSAKSLAGLDTISEL